MAYKIVWSDEAQNDFKNVIFYLQDNWSVQSAEKFVSHTFKIVEQLAEVPSRARPTSKENIFLYKLDKKKCFVFFPRKQKRSAYFEYLSLSKRYYQK